ncbi:MAG: aminopeptidase N [Pseudomonadota bacterium]
MDAQEAAPSAILLKDYQPTTFATEAVTLTFELADGETRVTAVQQVQRRDGGEAPADLVLDGVDLTLDRVSVNGQVLGPNEYQVDETSLTLFAVPATAEVEVVTWIHPEANTALEGLYKSGAMYCTQCEAEGFRKITYYQDRPDVLARFTTHIVAEAGRYPTMLANGNCTADRTLSDGRRQVTWEDPFPKPSYLFALVAGDLAHIEDSFTTASGRRVTLQIYSEPHNIGQCDFAMGALKRSMRWDEEAYGREYDLDIFMIVAVDDFNMGAMENKGLNIFNTAVVLATPDTATDASYQRVEGVVAHEYFHNWSGNRVTCRDWFQLSLKEGFTVFRDAQYSSEIFGATDKRIEDVSFLRSVQFAEDAGPLAHPIRPDRYIEISNFYTVTIYEKGAEVVGMLHTLLGREQFRAGSDLYFERHDGEAATTDDFVAAMANASGRDLSVFRRWYAQAGTPVLSVREAYHDGELTLTLAQTTPATPGQPEKEPVLIPVRMGLLGSDGRPLSLGALSIRSDTAVTHQGEQSLLLELDSEATELKIGGLSEPPAVSFLRGFSAPVRVDYPRPAAAQALLVRHDPDGFARWDVLQDLLVNAIFAAADGLATAAEQRAAVETLFAALLDEAATAPLAAEPLSLLANMLALPTENYLFEQRDEVAVMAVVDAREALESSLGEVHFERWLTLYEAHNALGVFEPTPIAMARRRLANLSLSYLAAGAAALGDDGLGGRVREVLFAHLEEADNLTDRRGALAVMLASPLFDSAERRRRLDAFYQAWQDEALVVNLWLQLQAMAPQVSVADLVALEAHVAFDRLNPNKVRSLYSGFAHYNARQFHRLDGEGYRFLAERVIALNGSNPQLAARLAIPLSKWRSYAAPHRDLMRAELAAIAARDDLSKDVYEIVHKSLADD